VSIPDRFHRYWIEVDLIQADVRPTPWGAVVTRPSAPDVWDVNYARIDRDDHVALEDVEDALVPALRDAGVVIEHVVSFHPRAHVDLFERTTARGHSVGWDAVMAREGRPAPPADPEVEELVDPDELPTVVTAILREGFAVQPDEAIEQFVRLDGEALRPAGKRWFGIRDAGDRVVSAGTLLVVDGLGYVDDVATLPHARGRGHASSVVTRIVAEAGLAGADVVTLLADPAAPRVIAMYERLGFRETGRIVSSRGPVPAA